MKKILNIGDNLDCINDRIYEGERCFTKGISYKIIGLEDEFLYFIDDVGDEFQFGTNFVGQFFKINFIFGR